MKIREIAQLIESAFPLSYAYDGDNVGLIVGDADTDITGILTTCDVDINVVDEAIEKGCNLIVSHHPLMFHAVSRLTECTPEQRTLRKMVQNGIALYSAHTNLDVGKGGINDLMAEMLGMVDTSVIDVVCTDERGTHGYGRMCDLPQQTTLKELLDKVMDTFSPDGLRYAGDINAPIKRLAINTGGGAGITDLCIAKGCDCFVTGDVKYNGYRDSVENGMCVIDIMHFDSEKISKKWFADFFRQNGVDVVVCESCANINLIKTYTK